MTASANRYDVIVIGGGPGGSTCASYLRMMGYTVGVYEKEIFPRDHVGESLIPFTYFKLKELGVLDEVMKFATKKPGVNFVDRDGLRQSAWCFDRILEGGAEMSLHTLRAPFDHALLKRSAELGAEIHEGCTVKDVDLSDPASATIRLVNAEGKEETVRSKFLVDASGQHSFLASRLGGREPYPGLDRIALFTHWIETEYDDALKGGLIKIVYLGGEKQGWIWVIPVGRNHLSIGVTLNNSYVKAQKKILGDDWKTKLYQQEITEAIGLIGILREAKIEHEIQTLGDYSFRVKKKYGVNYAHVGDSGAFLDPIFSSGIYVAMEVAERVTKCIDVKFREGEEAAKEIFRTQFEDIEGAYRLIEKFVRLFYDPQLLNFSHTGSDGYNKFHAAYEVFHYLLAGDFFSDHRKYEEFLDTLNRERNFNQFIHFVRKQASEYPLHSYCQYTYEEIYGHLPPAARIAPGLLRHCTETKKD